MIKKSKRSLRSQDKEGVASAATAWVNGRLSKQNGDLLNARLWLERATRLAPKDPRISLELADLCVTLGRAEDLTAAAAQFQKIASAYRLPLAWLGLAVAQWRLGGHAAAGATLGQMLGRYAIPNNDTGAFANLVVRNSGHPGWCGLLPSGALTVSIPKISFALDGKPARLTKNIDGFILPSKGQKLRIHAGGQDLLGSPTDLAFLRRVEGVVDCNEEGLFGWAASPANPSRPPDLFVVDAHESRYRVKLSGELPPDDTSPFLQRHRFLIPRDPLKKLVSPFRLCNADGEQIFGSPIDINLLAVAPSLRSSQRSRKTIALPERRTVSVIVPVYRGLETTRNCLHSLLAALPENGKIVVIDDASPEPELSAWLDGRAASGAINLLRMPQNSGFPAAVNAGIAAAGATDILLLNSDTLVPKGAIETMTEAAYSRADIGSVTPFSNAATILNYPDQNGNNPIPDLAETERLNRLARQANGIETVRMPTGIGFCMLLRHDCIATTGSFRSDIFAQGYGEENDWCLRAEQSGYIHVAALGAYVAHVGSTSFGVAGQALNQRNAGWLNRIYPGYHKRILKYIAADGLAPARHALDIARFQAGRNTSGAVLLISHHHGGGVARQVQEEMLRIRGLGQRPILLFPAAPADPFNTPFPWQAQLTDGDLRDYPNLKFSLPEDLPALLALLGAEGIVHVQLHHMLGHHPAVRNLATRLAVPQDIIVHDYASFCLRVNLLTRFGPKDDLRYCGEPHLAGCVSCIDRNGDETFEDIGVEANLARSAREFAAARDIFTPSLDAARRLASHFPGIQPKVTPWEEDDTPMTLRPPQGDTRRKVAVIGGIGPAKGFDILIDCAKDAVSRNLSLEFIVVGASSNDAKLLKTGGILITGAYEATEVGQMIALTGADLAFIPSIWPETWCFTLSEAWRAGLYTIAFDLGAQAGRIRATGRGGLLPLGLPAARINDALLAWQPNLGNSNDDRNKAVFKSNVTI